MSELKMRDALITVREVLVLEGYAEDNLAIERIDEALAQQAATDDSHVTVLPDGSAYGVMSFPLPEDHWLYAPREYSEGAYEPQELPQPILTHALRAQVVAAIRYAVRGATMCGTEADFDPDALVQNAVYALCGPFTSIERAREALAQQPAASTYDPTGQAAFKAFHASLCRRFGYTHDENYWWRDLVSLEEHIVKQAQPAAVVKLTDEEIEAAAGGTLFAEELEMLRRVLAALKAKQGGAA